MIPLLKKSLFLTCIAIIMLAITNNAVGQNKQQATPTIVEVKFVNSSLLPKKITFITYQPSQQGNGTTGALILPKGNKKFQLEVGTKVFLANKAQVDVVMSGASLVNQKDKPFCTVGKEPKQSFILP